MIGSILSFIEALPALIRLFKILKDRIDEADTDRKVKDDVKAIHEAFDQKDTKKLYDLFKVS